MNDNIRPLPSMFKKKKERKERAIQKFLKKPMHETTIGDTLVLNASVVIITIVISTSIQGWMVLASKGFDKQIKKRSQA